MTASIYLITNIINYKVYVGFTDFIDSRWQKHMYEVRKGNSSMCIHKAIRKYGIENFKFEIIYQSWDSEHCLKIMEPYFIKKYNSNANIGYGYNRTFGGNGVLGRSVTEEHKQKIRDAKVKYWKIEKNRLEIKRELVWKTLFRRPYKRSAQKSI